MFMAFLYWEVRINQGWPAPLALIFVILIAAPLLGVVLERLIMRKLVHLTLVVQLVVTIGLMFFFMGLATTIWDENTISPLPEFFADKHGIDIGNVVLTWHRFITIMVAIGIAIFLRLLLYRSRTGVAMRAVVDNRDLAGPERRQAGPGLRVGVGARLLDGRDRRHPAGTQRRVTRRRAHVVHRRRVRGRHHRPAPEPAVDVRGRSDHRGHRRPSRSTS